MLADFMVGNFRLPAQDEPLRDLHRVGRHVRAQQRLGLELAFWITDQYLPDGQGRQTAMKPDRRLRDELDGTPTFALPIRDRHAPPLGLGISGDLLQRRQALALLARSAR